MAEKARSPQKLTELPYLDVTTPGFSTRSDAVLQARAESWCAHTPFGIAVLRHAQAGQLLRDRRLRQGSYDWPRKVGLKGAFADFWMRSIISLEGAAHKRQRRIAQAALAEADILALCPDFTQIATDLTAKLPAHFDFVEQFSEPFAGLAIARLLGLPDADAHSLGRDASTLGLAMGVNAKQHEAAANDATDRLICLASDLLNERRSDVRPGSFVDRLKLSATEQGLTDAQALLDLIVISIFGGVDTTRAQLAFAVALFIEAPEKWAWLRENRDAIPAAIEDVIRHHPTTTWSSRETLETIQVEGLSIPAGTTMLFLVHATATDPDVGYSGGFDPAAHRKSHFGFGGGAHHCLGHFVARTDMACALGVLLDRWTSIEWAGSPEMLPDSGNTSPRKLPIRPLRA